jgi:hypothetical protein
MVLDTVEQARVEILSAEDANEAGKRRPDVGGCAEDCRQRTILLAGQPYR